MALRPESRLRGALGGTGAKWLLAPPLAFITLVLLVPLGYVVVLSFDGGFGAALDNETFLDSIPRTFLLAFTVTLFATILGTAYAIALAVAPRGIAIVMTLCLFTIFWMSLLVRTYGWLLLYLPQGGLYWALNNLGLRDEPLGIFQTDWAAHPAMVHIMLPYVVLPVYAAMRQIDPTHLRAARTLGARPPRILFRVLLPQLKLGVISASVLVFIMSLGFYVTPVLLSGPTNPTVAAVIGGQLQVPGAGPVAAAMSVLLLAVIAVVYAVSDRIFRISEQWGAAR